MVYLKTRYRKRRVVTVFNATNFEAAKKELKERSINSMELKRRSEVNSNISEEINERN